MGRSVVIIAALILSFSVVTGQASTPTVSFHSALEAARKNDTTLLERFATQQSSPHPLQAYLDFHTLRIALPALEPQAILDYGNTYDDSPLPRDLRDIAIAQYGQAQQWDALLAISPTAPRRTELRCFYYQAKWQRGEESALTEAASLWQSGTSRPDSCDPLFKAAIDAQIISKEDIWKRQQLAFLAGNHGLMRYLGGQLKGTRYESASAQLQTLYHQPATIATQTKATREQTVLIHAALHRWAAADTVAAWRWYTEHSEKAGYTDLTQRKKSARRIAWFSTIRGIDDNRAWRDQWIAEHGDVELLEQRARRAVIEQDWAGLPLWIGTLPGNKQSSARWQYWLARAHDEQDLPDAAALYQQASEKRSFFAFLAADTLGEPYRFGNNQQTLAPLTTAPPAIERITRLLALGENHAATQEWQWLLWHSNHTTQQQLAHYAMQQGWSGLSVQAAIQAKTHNRLQWRFPAAYQSEFQHAADEYALDPWLAMAVARRESALNPRARSPVGARGLMQLMPATAKKVARDSGLGTVPLAQLYESDINIQLGSYYLASLLKRYQGNRLLALAAYNAGPHKVDAWLGKTKDALPVDVWIESIPYRETRDYVQAVLTYRALLVGLHDQQPRSAQLLTEAESDSHYSLALLDTK